MPHPRTFANSQMLPPPPFANSQIPPPPFAPLPSSFSAQDLACEDETPRC
jgi:hypothetical protein